MTTRQQSGRRGGKVTAAQSKAKARALAALHRSRRGKRVHPDSRERETVLAAIANLTRDPVWGERSIRVVAQFCRVSDRTMRRWLSGLHWPPLPKIRRMAEWARRHAS